MSNRPARVQSLLRELAAAYIQHEANTDPLITITRTGISPDYRKVTIFFTTIPDHREEDALVFLKRSGSAMRSYIKQNSNLKIIPFLDFMVDYGERHRQHIDEIAHEIQDQDKK